MKGLFDQGVPAPLRSYLPNHQIDTAAEQGWSNLENGDLLNEPEAANYEIFVTTDQNLKYQQNLGGRRIAIVIEDNGMASHPPGRSPSSSPRSTPFGQATSSRWLFEQRPPVFRVWRVATWLSAHTDSVS